MCENLESDGSPVGTANVFTTGFWLDGNRFFMSGAQSGVVAMDSRLRIGWPGHSTRVNGRAIAGHGFRVSDAAVATPPSGADHHRRRHGYDRMI